MQKKVFNPFKRHLLLCKGRHDFKGLQYYKNIYQLRHFCVDINGHVTHKFFIKIGACQGDTVSPTLFNILNDLVQEINSLDFGILLYNAKRVSVLPYADDIALVAESERDLQKILVIFHWGQNW